MLPGAEVARRGVLAGMGPEPIVLFLSRIHPKKGGETLIRAVAQVRSGGRPCSLVFAGTGEDAYVGSLRALAAELGLEGAVRFVGLVRGAEKLSLYQAAAVLAIPTHQEDFGLVFPESLACGTPVVTTRGVDIWPELESSGGAVIVDRTPGAFAEAIGGLVADADRARARASGRVGAAGAGRGGRWSGWWGCTPRRWAGEGLAARRTAKAQGVCGRTGWAGLWCRNGRVAERIPHGRRVGQCASRDGADRASRSDVPRVATMRPGSTSS